MKRYRVDIAVTIDVESDDEVQAEVTALEILDLPFGMNVINVEELDDED